MLEKLYEFIPYKYKGLRKLIAKQIVKRGNIAYIRRNIQKKGYSKCPICKKGYFRPDELSENRQLIAGCRCDNCGVFLNVDM